MVFKRTNAISVPPSLISRKTIIYIFYQTGSTGYLYIYYNPIMGFWIYIQFCKSCYVVVVVVIAVFIFLNSCNVQLTVAIICETRIKVLFITFGALWLHKVEMFALFSVKR